VSAAQDASGIAVRVFDWVGLAARLFLGYTFITAGLDKLPHESTTQEAVFGYQLLPGSWLHAYAATLPAVELVLGIALVLGIFTRSVAVLLALGLCSFLMGISSAWQRGLSIDCGCFGGAGSTTNPHYLEHIFRDSGYLALAVLLIVLRHTAVAASTYLFGRRS